MAFDRLDSEGLLYLWQKIKNVFAYKTDVPTKVSDLTNDSGFEANVQSDWNESDSSSDAFIKNKPTIPDGVSPATNAPVMDGTAAVGTSTKFAREDHVHPSDTSRVPTTRTVNSKALSADITLTASDVSAVPTSEKGSANGVCPLDSSGLVDSSYLPSYVDDVIEAYPRTGQTELSSTWLAEGSASGTVITPESGKIYMIMSATEHYAIYSQFRWGGTVYGKINDGGRAAITNAQIDTIVAS